MFVRLKGIFIVLKISAQPKTEICSLRLRRAHPRPEWTAMRSRRMNCDFRPSSEANWVWPRSERLPMLCYVVFHWQDSLAQPSNIRV